MREDPSASGCTEPDSPWTGAEGHLVPFQTPLAVAGADQVETYSCSAQGLCLGLFAGPAHRSAGTSPVSCDLQEQHRSLACRVREAAGFAARSHCLHHCCSNRRNTHRRSTLRHSPRIHSLLPVVAAEADTCLEVVVLGGSAKSVAVGVEACLARSAHHRVQNPTSAEVVPSRADHPCARASFSSSPAGQIQALRSRHSLLGQVEELDVGLGSLEAGSFVVDRASFAGSPLKVSGRSRPRRDLESGLCLLFSLYQYRASSSGQESVVPRRGLSCVACPGTLGMGYRRILAVPEISETG